MGTISASTMALTRTSAAVSTRFLCLTLAAAALSFSAIPALAQQASFGEVRASPDALHIANWAVRSADHHGMPFVVVDKLDSRVYVFDGQGRLLGSASALLGLAQGDASVPGIGNRKMSTIRPDERTTPAGRFAASMERSLHGDEILWVDYDAAIALHRVIATVPKERRLQRLASQAPLDRRITYGCINVPVKFFEEVVIPAFKGGGQGIVYVLPETRSVREVFGSYDADENSQFENALAR
jgi:hypothetical protein